MSFLKQYPQLKIIRDSAKTRGLKIYLIGGFLRDLLLNRHGVAGALDFDFAIEKDAISFAQSFARTIKGVFVLLDQENGCGRGVKKYEGKSLIFDFADFRAKTLRGDLAHRDFTINTLCVDLDDLKEETEFLKVIRNFKNGKKDLKLKTIRMVSAKVFQEDALRLLRAFSLRAALGFKIESKTLVQIKKDRGLLKDVSLERIRDEFFKILASNRAFENLRAMDHIGLLEEVIPQIRVMFGVKQGGYHHLDVWPHSLQTVHQLEKILQEIQDDKNQQELNVYLGERLSGTRLRRDLLKLAALLHDIGKPDTQKQEKDRMSFHGHEHVGAAISRSVARMLKLSVHERHMLEDIVRWHLRPGYLSNFKNPSERSIFRYFRDTKEEALSILLLSLADQRSTRGPMTSEVDQNHHETIVRKLIDRYFEIKRQKPFVRLINGHDLIKKLKLKPSPLFAKILREIEEKQTLGKIQSKEEALALAQKIADSAEGKRIVGVP